MTRPLDLVFFGLSLSSAWGNGHATTYRSLLRGLRAEGNRVLFLECDKPWYAAHRDLPSPDFCVFALYHEKSDLIAFEQRIACADAVIVGSYVPDGVALIDYVRDLRPAFLGFYDIDTPVTLAKLDAGDEEYLARRQVPLFDSYFSFSGGSVLERLRQQYGAQRPIALYCSVDAPTYIHTGEDEQWALSYLGTYSPDRQPALERLLLEPARRLPAERFVVAGPQYPADIDWPPNVERIEHLPPAGHPSFYSRSRYTLNITRRDMVAAGYSPSVRLFEAAACSTPIISDRWPGLTDLLPETEAVIIADTSDDVVRALQLTPQETRSAMASAARERILHEHTGEARARQLAQSIQTIPTETTSASGGFNRVYDHASSGARR